MSISTSRTLGASNGRALDADAVAPPAPRRGAARGRPPNPVAMAVTRTSSPIASSITAPKMTFAFESAALVTTCAASSTSASPRSGPPVMLRRMPGSAVERRLEKRRRDRGARRLDRAVVAARDADAHERRAGVAHDRAHVREVEVDEARDGDEVGDALDALAQDVVHHAERLGHRGRALDDLEQAVVLDDDQRVDVLAQRLDSLLGLVGPQLPFERERPRDDADRERAELAPDLGDDGRTARPGAAALARGDEDHVRALERFLQLVPALLGRGEPHARVGAGAETARRLRPDVDLLVGLRHQERLRVGVHGDELDARDARLDHARHRVRAAAADADDLDDGEIAA